MAKTMSFFFAKTAKTDKINKNTRSGQTFLKLINYTLDILEF